MGEKEGRVFRNNYKGHMDKARGGWKQGRGVGMAGVSRCSGGKMETAVLEQQLKNVKKKIKR